MNLLRDFQSLVQRYEAWSFKRQEPWFALVEITVIWVALISASIYAIGFIHWILTR